MKKIVYTALLGISIFMVTPIVFAEQSTTTETSRRSDISFFISPSKIYDENIPLGESKEFKFRIGNRAEGKFKDYNLDIEIEGVFESESGDVVNNEDIISVDKSKVTLKPNEIIDVKLNVNIPKDFNIGNYTAYIDFTKKPISEAGILDVENTLRVPIYMFVGDKEAYLKTSVDYDVGESYITFNGEKPEFVRNEVFENIKKGINPFNFTSVISEIINKPFYNVIYREELRTAK